MVEARRWAVALMGLCLVGSAGGAWAQDLEPSPLADPGMEADIAHEDRGPDMASELARWVLASSDNEGLPFIVIDKTRAEVFVYDAEGQLKGAAPALLGSAAGDTSAPGVGDKALSAIRPGERTTPAGRFVSSFGPAYGQPKVLWIDYGTAISLHPVVTSNPKERRAQRLRTPTGGDNRITFGCINVAPAFYRDVVTSTLRSRGVVYVLPESLPIEAVFPAYHLWAQTNAAPVVLAAHAGDQATNVASEAIRP
jgi:hypothetical protein